LPQLAGMTALFLACASSEEPNCQAVPASDRETICVARSGGQTGMEGSCGEISEPPAFSADDARALIKGTRTTSLGYRPERWVLDAPANGTAGLPLTVRVELDGEARVLERYGCSRNVVEQNVVVTLSLEDPPLDVVIESTAYAFSRTFAVLQNELNKRAAAALGLPASEPTLSLAFGRNGIEADIDPHDDCGSAVIPADVRCPGWPSIEVDLDRERDGFRPRDALQELETFEGVPLRWQHDGGTTMLSISITKAPEWACTDDFIETSSRERLSMSVSIRAMTADGRLDAELPAELSVSVATSAGEKAGLVPSSGSIAGRIQELSLSVSDALVPSGAALSSAAVGEPAVSLHAWKGIVPQWEAEGRVLALESRDPGLTSPLDATVDEESFACVIVAGRAGAEPGRE
jgi:hypothetical protein